MSIYLDYNASTPIDERVLENMISIYRDYYGNADSRTHDYGVRAKQAVESARGQVASLLGAAPNEIVFTSGATESNNIAIQGLIGYANETGKKHIITTAIEHKAVLEPFKELEKQGFEAEYIRPDQSGRIDADELLARVRDDTLLVSVMHANNETGIIQPIQEIGDVLHSKQVLFHVDAAQSCGKLVSELKASQYDMLSLTGHKMYGPQGIGALVLKAQNNKKPPIKPITFGGGHERGLRPGTLPVALIVGLGKACEMAEQEYMQNALLYKANKDKVFSVLEKSSIQYTVNGDQKYCLDNTLNISFLGLDSEALMIATKQYCSISNGSACTSQDYSSSHVLRAMSLDEDRIESAVRLSWGKEEVDSESIASMISIVNSLV